MKKRMQEVGDSLVSIEQELAAVKSETNDSFNRVSTDIDNTGGRQKTQTLKKEIFSIEPKLHANTTYSPEPLFRVL